MSEFFTVFIVVGYFYPFLFPGRLVSIVQCFILCANRLYCQINLTFFAVIKQRSAHNLATFFRLWTIQNIVHGGNEFGNGGEMGPGVSGQSHKNYIFMAGTFDLPAGNDASGLGVEYDFEKDSGIVGGGSGDVVFETVHQSGRDQLMINKMVQGIFEGAGENLLGKMNGNEFVLGVGVRFVTISL